MGSEGVGSKDTIEMNEPVATRTRRSTKLQHPSKAEKTKNITGKLQMETKENMKSILLQLRQQNQQQQDRLTEMNVMLKNVLELQLSIVHELRKDVEAELQSKELEKLPLPGPERVNSRTATNEIGADTSEASSRPFEQKVTHEKMHQLSWEFLNQLAVKICALTSKQCNLQLQMAATLNITSQEHSRSGSPDQQTMLPTAWAIPIISNYQDIQM